MNKKTILFLINGFGVEKKESYPIYDEKLMPTFDELSKKYLFVNDMVISKVSNYYDAYRNASLDVNELYNYTIIDSSIATKTFTTNKVLTELQKVHNEKKSNLHIFCLVDTSLKIVSHLKETLKLLNPNKDKKIFLHLIISSSSIEDYKDLVEVFSHINIELADYASIGFIMGLSAIDNNAKQVDLNFFFKMFITKVGEKWQSFTQRFDVLYTIKTLPRDTKPFIVNSNFEFSKDDIFFFFNYDTINLENFLTTLSNISFGEEKSSFSYYSLFPVISKLSIPFMFETSVAKNSLVFNLEKIKATGLILCKKEKVGIINYFCNGLVNSATKTLTFIDIDPYINNQTALVELINKATNEFIILNFELDECKTTMELKELLKTLDNNIKALEENRNGSKYTLIVSSLYGMNKTLTTEKDHPCQVIFTGKVPFLYIDDFITKKNYLVAPGTINDLFKTAYKSINKDYKGDSLVEKKNGLYKLFFK